MAAGSARWWRAEPGTEGQRGPVQHQEAELGLARVAQTEVKVSELRRQKLEVAIVRLLVS